MDGDEYTLLSPDSRSWEETKKKAEKDTAWFIKMNGGEVTAARVKYEKLGRPVYGSYRSAPADPVKAYHIDQIPDIAPEERKAVAEKLEANINSSYRFREKVRERVLRAVIAKRLKEESRENMAALYLDAKFSGMGEDEELTEDGFTDEEGRYAFEAVFGPEGITRIADIPEEPLSGKLFLFLTAAWLETNDLPGLDDNENEWAATEKSMFWKFAQMDREEYLRLYREILAEAVKEAVAEKPEDSLRKSGKGRKEI